jgi:chloride channel protein, CIC family
MYAVEMAQLGRFRSAYPSSKGWLMALALVIGVGAGLGAAVLILALRAVSTGVAAVGDAVPSSEIWYFLAVPGGIWLAWLVASRWAPEASGHGVPQILESLVLRGGEIAPRIPVVKTIATALTIGVGGSAGREGSIAQIGAGIGSQIGKLTKLGEVETRALVAAGAGAGIAATFNAPIAGMFFAMEVVLRDLSIRHLHTIAIASVAGAVVSHSLIGSELTFQVSPYGLESALDLVLYALLGLVAAGLAIAFIEALEWSSRFSGVMPAWARPVIFGLFVAGIGTAIPEVLGTGQQFIGEVLRQDVSKVWWLYVALAVAKLASTSLTLGGKGAGGIFMPSLFIGAMSGAAFAAIADPVWTVSSLSPGAFALVGMAAVFAGVSRASFTSILIVFEITGDYGLVLPLMVAVAIATVLANRLHPESAYTAPLVRMGINTMPADHVDLLATLTIADLGLGPPITVAPEDSLTTVEGVLRANRVNGAAVVDSAGKLVGIVAESDIMRVGGPSDQVRVSDAMTVHPATVSVDLPVSEALERMAILGVGRLPVVDRRDPERIEAMFERDDAVAAHHLALGTAARGTQMRQRFLTTTSETTQYHEFEIPRESVAAGRQIKAVPWPEGCIVVSVHRGTQLLVASGDVELRPGDALTVFCDDAAWRRLVERLMPGPSSLSQL